MSIEDLLEIEKLLFSATMDKFGVARHDLKIISACKGSRESLYTLENKYDLDRALTIRRLKILEAKGFIKRNKVGKAKIIELTDKSNEVIRFIESINILGMIG